LKLLRKLMQTLFWVAVGVLMHDYAHALYLIGGYREILSLQGGWIALAVIVVLWLAITSIDAESYFAAKVNPLKEFSKGSLAVIGVVVAQIAVKLLKKSTTSLAVILLALGLGFLLLFVYLVNKQINKWVELERSGQNRETTA